MLKGRNGCSLARITSLASLSLESLKNQRGRSERALLGFVPDQFKIEARERERVRVRVRVRLSEGILGVFILHTQKLVVAQGLPK